MYLDIVKSIEKTKIKKKEADNLLYVVNVWKLQLVNIPRSAKFIGICRDQFELQIYLVWCKRWGLLLTKQQKYSLNEWLENVHYKYWENYIQFSIDNVYYSTSIAL